VCVCVSFRLFSISWAAPAAYGGSQARGQIGAVATGLHHSHSNAGIPASSSTYATGCRNSGSLTHWARSGIEPATSWFLVGFANHCAMTGTPRFWIYFKDRVREKSQGPFSNFRSGQLERWSCLEMRWVGKIRVFFLFLIILKNWSIVDLQNWC